MGRSGRAAGVGSDKNNEGLEFCVHLNFLPNSSRSLSLRLSSPFCLLSFTSPLEGAENLIWEKQNKTWKEEDREKQRLPLNAWRTKQPAPFIRLEAHLHYPGPNQSVGQWSWESAASCLHGGWSKRGEVGFTFRKMRKGGEREGKEAR